MRTRNGLRKFKRFGYVCVCISLTFFIHQQAHAQPKHIFSVDIYSGYSRIIGQSQAAKPKLMQTAFGASLGSGFGSASYKMFVGAMSDFRWISQYSNTEQGNAYGQRWNMLSPFLGIKVRRFFLKSDYQFLGNYRLARRGLYGEKVSYTTPRGWRTQLAFSLTKNFSTGIFYEDISFKKLKIGEVSTTLQTKLRVWQTGVSFGLEF